MTQKTARKCWNISRLSKAVLAWTLSGCLLFQPFMIEASAQQIVPDGRTQTNVTVQGAVTDVTTATINNGSAFNSFSKFDVNNGNTVNVYVPVQADRLINIVRDKQTNIDGILNTYQNGAIGGDVYFLNPHGIVVGETGVINTGRLTLQTPTREFTEELLNDQGAISQANVQATIKGQVPLSKSGFVRIKGEINATDKVIIQTLKKEITGTIREGAEAQRVIFENVVNTNGVQKSATGVVVSSDGRISLLGPGQSAPRARTRTVRKVVRKVVRRPVRRMIVVDQSPATRTETALQIREGHVDISTKTIKGNNAYNSFRILDVYRGQTVNLIVPSNVSNLVNVVHDKRSDINGQLNALKDGRIGGNVFFLNPHGVLVGSSGVIRAGSVTIATPGAEDVDRLLKTVSAPDQNDALALLNIGALQKNSKGIVNVQGLIEAKGGGITLAGKTVDISGRLTAEAAGAAGIVPKIVIHSVEDTAINGGKILAEGASGRDGGQIEIRAGNNIAVKAGSLVSVSGKGATSNAGSIVIFAENDAELGVNATILASGGEVSGDGGFIEFSGRKTVTLAGGTLRAEAVNGKGGRVLIDPEEINISANTCLGCAGAYSGALSAGAAFSLEASKKITLGENVFLSTRQVGGAIDRASHESGASTGDSGDVTLTAPEIVMMNGSAIFAHATGNYAGGDVKLDARTVGVLDAILGALPIGVATRSIRLDNATITGDDIALSAKAENYDAVAIVLQVGKMTSEVSVSNGSRLAADGALSIDATALSIVPDLALNVNRPYLLSSANVANASVTIDNASLTAQDDVDVEAKAQTVSLASDLLTDSILPLPIPFDAAVGVALSKAEVRVRNGSSITSLGGDVNLIADSRAKVEAIGTARNIAFGLLKIPYIAAISVGVIDNDAVVTVDDSTVTAHDDVNAHAYALSQNNTSFDVFGDGATKGAFGIGFNFTNHNAVARVRNSDITAQTGNIGVLTDSILLAKQSGSVTVSDKAIDSILELIDVVVTGIVSEFFTENGQKDETGERITLYWGKTKTAAKDIDLLASTYSEEWKKKSAITVGRDKGSTVWAAAAGAQIALANSEASISADAGRTVTIDAAGALKVESRANALSQNSVQTKVTFDGENGKATSLALNLTYEDIANRAFVAADAGTGLVDANAASVSVLAGHPKVDKKDPDDDSDDVIKFRDTELLASQYKNGRSVIANATVKAPKSAGRAIAIGVGVSFRDVDAYVDNAALTVAANGAVAITADNKLSILYMEAGDNQDMAALSAAAAEKRLVDQLTKIAGAKEKAKQEAQQKAQNATNPEEKAAAEKQAADAQKDLDKAKAQETKAVASNANAQADNKNPVGSLGSSYTIGFNLMEQNTRAQLRSGAAVQGTPAANGAVGAISVAATSSIKKGGLSTYAALNGAAANSASTGTVLNVGVNVLLGETVADVAARDPSAGGANTANDLRSTGDISVTATNTTSFDIVNNSYTPAKVKKDATAATMITLSGGVQMLDTTATLGRNIYTTGDLTVGAATANSVSTNLIASTAGGATSPASNAITNTLGVLEDIAGYVGADTGEEEDPDDEPSDEEQGADTASLGIAAIVDIGIVANAVGNSAKLAESAKKAKEAEDNAKGVMKEKGKKDFVLSAAFSFNSFDSKAATADGLILHADGVTVGAYNETDADVTITSTSEFEEGAGATVFSVAANLANQDNTAEIGANSEIVLGSGGLLVDAGTKSWGSDDAGNPVLVSGSSDFFAKAAGKSKLKGKQLIMSLGLNIVDFENMATIGDNVTIMSADAYNAVDQSALQAILASSSGQEPDVTVSSYAKTVMKAEGNAASGKNGLFFDSEDGLLSYHQQFQETRGAALGFTIADMSNQVIGTLLDYQVRQRQDELTGAIKPEGEGDAKGFGLGINIGSIDILAGIGNDNALVDLGDIKVSMDARVRTSAKGVAGTGPSDAILSLTPKVSKSAASAKDAAGAINVVYGDVSASIGTGRTGVLRAASGGVQELRTDGYASAASVTVSAKTQAMAEAYSDGKAAGAQAADGVSGAINLHDFDTTATLASSVRATGEVSVTATADTVEIVQAEASARGTPIERYAATVQTALNNLLIGPSANKSATGKAQSRFMSKYNEISAKTKEFKKSKTTQSFAAAMGFNFADHDTKAIVADNVRIETTGAITIRADHDAMSMTEVSGAAVLSDKATGAAFAGNLILTTVETKVGNNVVLGSAERTATDVTVESMSRFNTGVNVDGLLKFKKDDDGNYVLENGQKVLDETFPEFTYSAEAIAGAGGKGSSVAGAFAGTIYDGDTHTVLGNNVSIVNTGDTTIGAYERSKIANKAWGVSAALGSGTSTTKSARGAVSSVIYRGRSVTTTIGNDFKMTSGGDAEIVAKVLRPSQAWVGPDSDSGHSSTTWFDYVDPVLGGDIAAPLRNADPAVTQSLHNQVIAAAAAGQSTSASYSGAIGITVAAGETKVVIGDRAKVSADTIDIESVVSQEMIGIGGSLTVSLAGKGGTYGAQGAVNVILDEVATEIGSNGEFTSAGGSTTFGAAADTEAMSITAVATLSGAAPNNVAANLATNTFEGDVKTTLGDNVRVVSAGDVAITADNSIDAFAFAGTLGVTFSTNSPVAATIVNNNQLSTAEARVGAGASITSTAGSIALAASTNERLLSIPAAGGGRSGVLSITVVDSDTRAIADKTSTLTANNGNVSVTADNASDILEIAGSVGFAMSGNALGLTMPGSGVSKRVEAQVGNAFAKNIEVSARSENDIRQLAGAGALATSSTGVGGTVGVLVLDNAVTARIAEGATVAANGNVWVDADDDSSLLQFGGAVGAGKSVGVGASIGVLVVLGSTLTEVGANANVTARGLENDVVTITELQQAKDAEESQRTGIVGSFEALAATGTQFADNVEAAFDALGAVGQSKSVRDNLLDAPTTTRNLKGFVMTADGDHRAVVISLALGAGKSAGVGGVVDVGVFDNSVDAHVRSGAKINEGLTAASQGSYGASQDVLVSAQSTGRVIGFGGMVGAASTAGVGGGATVNVFNGTTSATVDTGAVVKARHDVGVIARRAQDIGTANFALGAAGTAGVGAAVNVTVIGGSTEARIDGRADALRNVAIAASEISKNLQVVGAIGAAGTAGVGGAVNVLVAKSTTSAVLGAAGAINALGDTSVTARAQETMSDIIVAGGGGGTAGIGASVNVVDSRRGVSAFAYGAVNQEAAFRTAGSGQDVIVEADSTIDMYRLVGGVGGGGTVGVGVAFDMATVLNQTDAGIGGGARVFAGGDVRVDATSAKNYASNTIAGGGGGLVGVGGAIVINRTGFGDLNDYKSSNGDSAADGSALAGDIDGVVGKVMADSRADPSGDETLDQTVNKANSALGANLSSDETSVTRLMTAEGYDRTTATIGDGAVVVAGDDVDVTADDYDRVYQFAGSIGGGGVVGVGITVGVNDLDSTAAAAIGNGASVQAGGAVKVKAQNVAVLEAVNFAGAGGGVVGAAGSINFNRSDNDATASVGAGSSVTGTDVTINALNEQNLAATTVGLGGGLVGAGISYTNAKLGGGATVTVGNGATVKATAGNLNVTADQRARMSVDGLAGAGGAVAGQAAVSEIEEDSDAVVTVGDNVTLLADAGSLNVKALNRAWSISNAVGVAFGAVAAGYVHSYSDSFGDARVTVGNNHLVRGRAVNITAEIGELQDVGRLAGSASLATLVGDRSAVATALEFLGLVRSTYRRSDTFALAAAGGLGAAQGSNLGSETDNDAVVQIGTGHIESTNGDVTIEAKNTASLQSKVIGLTVGAVSFGAHVAAAKTYNDSRLAIGSTIRSSKDIHILANTNTRAMAESFSISGGVYTAGISRTNIVDKGSTAIDLADFGAKRAGDDIRAFGDVTIKASHNRAFDAKMNSFGVGVYGGGSGRTAYTLEGTSTVDVGANRKIISKFADDESNGEDIDIIAENVIRKDLLSGRNLDLKAYGAIAIADVASDVSVKTETGVTIGDNTEIYSADRLAVKSMARVEGDDSVNVDAAGAGADANGRSTFVHSGIIGDAASSTVAIGEGASLFAGEHLEVAAVTDTDMSSAGEGSAFGAAAALRVDSITKSTSENIVSIGRNATVKSFGEIFLGAGEDYAGADNPYASDGDKAFGFRVNSNDVASRVVSLIGAAIGIPKSNISDAIVKQNNLLNIAAGSQVLAGGDIHAGASDEKRGGAIGYRDVRNQSLTSILTAFMNVRGAVAETTKSGDITLNGTLRTGVDRDRSIAITGSNPSDVSGQGYNWRRGVAKNGDVWQVNYEAPLGDVNLRAGVNNGGLHGSGTISTPRDAELKIVNTSSKKLEIVGLSIPYLRGGKLYVNGTQIKAAGSSLLGSVGYTPPADDEDSYLSVLNSHVDGPDLVTTGTISNLGGGVTLANIYGSIQVRSVVQAAELKILAGKDFRIDTDQDVNLGNDPISEFESSVNALNNTQTSSDFVQTFPLGWATPQGARGEIRAFGNIYIKADGVNINGLIRSGVSGRETTVTQAMVDTALADAQRARYQSTRSEDDRYFYLNDLLGFDPLTATREQLESISIDDLAAIPLFYDYETGRIVAKNLEAQGGTITIEGRIASTGRGSVEALDGFARFDITNQTTTALELRNIDTGDGVEGTIIFNDHNFKSGDAFLQTRWARVGDEIVKYQDYSNALTDGLATTVMATGTSAASYDPLQYQRYAWTVEAEYYETRHYHSYNDHQEHLAKDDIDAINAAKNAAGSWSGVDVDWVTGLLSNGGRGWERYGSDRTGWGSPNYLGDPEGRLILDTSDTSEFRYVRDVTETDRELRYFEAEHADDGCTLFVCDKEWRVGFDYRIYYDSDQTYSTRADKTIGIGFFGEDTGRIDVDSQGDVVLGGRVRNISGKTILTSHQGGIYSAGTDENPGVLIANDITLTAATRIGSSLDDTFKIEQVGANPIVNASARSIYLEDTTGAMRVGQITVDSTKSATGGDLALIAHGDVDLRPSNMGSLVRAGEIHLESKTGRVLTNLAGNGLNVDTDAANGGHFSLLSRDTGTINLREISGDLLVKTIDIPGDLKLNVGGDLLDGVGEQDDFAALDAAFADFLDRKGIGTDAYTAEQTTLVNDSLAEGMSKQYHAYWAMRGAGTGTIADYDKTFTYQLADADREALAANGFSDADIAAYEAQQTAFYHDTHAALGAAATGSYDPNFVYVLSDEQRQANVEGLGIDRAAILTAVNAEVVGGNASGSAEESNIKARSLDIDLSGSIGSEAASFAFAAGADGKVSVADMQRMRTAEVGEVEFRDDGTIVVTERDGVSINTTDTVTVAAAKSAFLESQGDLKVNTITVGDTLQLKTSGDLLNANGGSGPNAIGRNLILSSAGAQLGTEANPFVTETTDDGFLQLRTAGTAHIEEATGDLRLQDAAGPVLNLTANDGRIVDAFNDSGDEINGDDVSLYARDGIGRDGEDVDVTTRVNGSIEVETPGDSFLYAPDLPVKVKEAIIGGLSKIKSATQILVESGKTFSAAELDWYAPEDIIFEADSKVVSRTGAAKIRGDLGLFMEEGSTLDAGNNLIDILVKGNAVLGNLVSTRTGDDAVLVEAGGSIDGNGDGLADIMTADPSALVRLIAKGGVGSTEAIVANISRLAVTNTNGGNVNVQNDRNLTVEQIEVGAGSGIRVETLGDLLARTVKAVDRDILLSASNNLTQDMTTAIDNGTGNITVKAGGNASLAKIKTGGLGGIDLTTLAGRVDLNDTVTTAEGGIAVKAATDLALGVLANIFAAGGGDVDLTAEAGSLTQDAATTIDGGTTGNVTVTAGRNAALAKIKTGGIGDIALTTLGGRVDLNDTVTAAEGGIAVKAATDLALGVLASILAAGGGDIGLTADTGNLSQNAATTVDGGTGNVTVMAGKSAFLDKILTGGAGSIKATAQSGLMNLNDSLTTAEGDVAATAATHLALGALASILAAGGGKIDLMARDGNLSQNAEATVDGGTGDVTVMAGKSAFLDKILTGGAGNIKATAQSGLMNLNDSLTTADGNVAAAAATHLALGALASIKAAGGGSIGLTARDGNLSQNAGATVDGGTGNVTVSAGQSAFLDKITTGGTGNIQAAARAGLMNLNDTLTTADGNVAATAATNLALGALASIKAAGGGSIGLTAQGGNLSQNAEATIDGGTGNIMVSAGQNAFLDKILTAGGGNIRATAQSGQMNLNDSLTTADGNVAAAAATNLALGALASIKAAGGGNIGLTAAGGNLSQDAEATVDGGTGNVTVAAGQNAFLDKILTGGTGNIRAIAQSGRMNLNDGLTTAEGNVAATAATDLVLGALGSILAAGGGDIGLGAQGGNLTQDAAATVDGGTGNVTMSAGLNAVLDKIRTGGEGSIHAAAHSGQMKLNDSLTTADGNVTASAATDLTLGALASILAAGRGNIDLAAAGGDLSQDTEATVDGGTGNVSMTAAKSAFLDKILTGGSGNVALAALGGKADLNDSVTTAEGNVAAKAATDLTLHALASILAAGGGNIDLAAGSGDLSQDEAATVNGGTGNVTATAGSNAFLDKIVTGGAGNVALAALGGKADLNDSVTTAEGHVSARAATDLTLHALASILAVGGGNIDLAAASGDLSQDTEATVDGGTGNVTATAGVNAFLDKIRTAGEGDVRLATGSGKVDLHDTVTTAEGDIDMTAATDLTLRALASILAAGRGDIDMTAAGGDLTQDEAATVNGGTGNMSLTAARNAVTRRLMTRGQGDISVKTEIGDLLLDDVVDTADGGISVVGNHHLDISADAVIHAEGGGDINLSTTVGNVTQQQGSLIDSGFGLLRVKGAYNVTLRDVYSRHASRFRILANATNHLDDGGNAHRNTLEAQVEQARSDVEARINEAPDLGRFLDAMRRPQTVRDTPVNRASVVTANQLLLGAADSITLINE